ncbi:hypothetical protein RCH06_002069 [Polaromonas sp. CG_9.5]|uniref:hypothetical protein n=1 Tax=Polaromonas sp. CG_9.5 TaxID=3071705 RepID=UPI002DF85E8B|nr:hypothetical protein [Polaromonas sp. CG_9.5]
MFLKADFFAQATRRRLWASGGWLATALLTGCTLPAAPKLAPDATPTTAMPPAARPGKLAFPPLAAPNPAPANEGLLRALAYADRVRTLSATELGQEVARLNHPVVPLDQLQLALALSQLRQPSELTRAQELLSRLLVNTDAQAQALHPLARLLAARYGEQRRLEDLLDKQTQQTRDAQRRLEQTQDRLEALKAIERSLTSRPHTPAAQAPANRARPTAP